MGEDLFILMVAPHACIRVAKEAAALRGLGYHVSLLTESGRVPDNADTYDGVYTYTPNDPASFSSVLKTISSRYDIIHYHNEPSYLMEVVREVTGFQKPLIFDYHDSNYWREDRDVSLDSLGESLAWHHEDVAVSMADGIVFPSEPCMEEFKSRPEHKFSKNSMIALPPAVPRSMYVYGEFDFVGGLVSQGGHINPERARGDRWRDYSELYKYLKEHSRKRIVALSSVFQEGDGRDKEAYSYYAGLGVLAGFYPYHLLLLRLPRHSWNMVGNWYGDSPDDQMNGYKKLSGTWIGGKAWRVASPNKFFDSLAAGIPSVIMNAPHIAEEAKEVSLIVDHPQELLDRWDEHRHYRALVHKKRTEFCMENYIGSLVELYKEVMR